MKKHKMFILALAIPIIVLIGMTVKPLQATYLGESIRLQTVPVDPRDLFYGDYVNLDFEIERVNFNLLDNELANRFKRNNNGNLNYEGRENKLDVYLSLEEVDGIHKTKSVTVNQPSNGIYVKGAMRTYVNRDNEMRIDIPIERYYLEENTGKQLEKDAREGRIIADLKVYKGYMILKGVEVKY